MTTELEFAAEYSRCENDVYRFILSLVPYRPDADELMQETARTLWEKYFLVDEPMRSFKAWACQIAFYEVLRYRKAKDRERLIFSQEVIEQLAAVREQHEDVLIHRRDALTKCLRELESPDVELLQVRYGIVTDSVSSSCDHPLPRGSNAKPITNAMSKRLQRLRRLLLHCVERKILEAPF